MERDLLGGLGVGLYVLRFGYGGVGLTERLRMGLAERLRMGDGDSDRLDLGLKYRVGECIDLGL